MSLYKYFEVHGKYTEGVSIRKMLNQLQKTWCPGWDLNPHSRCRKKDFKSFASADFATRADGRLARLFILSRSIVQPKHPA